MAMNMNLLLQQEIKVLRVENERKTKKKARRRAAIGNDTILSVQEGLDRVQQLNIQVKIQAEDSTSITYQQALPRCSICWTIGHNRRSCPNE